ncbi:MAG: hypothetical protein J4473_04570 [Candidatus Aenigmarchaeota archaeon]|nr:hypothetical protein [Candidatus Aenigmarchaeota archaeon]
MAIAIILKENSTEDDAYEVQRLIQERDMEAYIPFGERTTYLGPRRIVIVPKHADYIRLYRELHDQDGCIYEVRQTSTDYVLVSGILNTEDPAAIRADDPHLGEYLTILKGCSSEKNIDKFRNMMYEIQIHQQFPLSVN